MLFARTDKLLGLKTKLIRPLLRFDLLVLLVAASLLYSHVSQQIESLKALIPKQVYTLTFSTYFQLDDGETNIYTYLPLNNARQLRLQEEISGELPWSIKTDMTGRRLHWSGEDKPNSVRYKVYVATQAVKYSIEENLSIPDQHDDTLSDYLLETDVIQFNHPEIVEYWETIKPENSHNTLAVLGRIFDYTYNGLESSSFKGTTDALTAHRLGIASCNGKSRLFVALARLNNLPARLVGGVILEEGTKRTSHQWVEVFIENHWVPFGPTNGYFAEIPAHYLRLYQGDEALIRHTSNINFDYQFDVKAATVSPAFYSELIQALDNRVNLSVMLKSLNLSPTTVSIVLLFPLCTLLITFLRNVIGLKTYGIFMPMLIAAACLFSGLIKGLIGFSAILLFAWSIHAILDRMRLLKTARLAIVITCITACSMFLLWAVETKFRTELSVLSVFPVVIISFVAERIHQNTNQQMWTDCFKACFGTLVTICCCYFAMRSVLLQGVFSLYPEAFLVVLAAQLFIGSWSGLRLSELLRFKNILYSQHDSVLGINGRNRNLVYKHNQKKLLALAADKLSTKKILEKKSLPTPATLALFVNISDTRRVASEVERLDQFVIKPNCGSQGKGIIVIKQKKGNSFISASNKTFTIAEIEQHVKDIISGSFSQDGEQDIAYIEPLIIQHQALQALSPSGLCDIRIIVAKGQAVSAMLRIPTITSHGKANLHQGAVGVAIDIETGLTSNAQIKGRDIKVHPDTKKSLKGIQLPFWQQIVRISSECYSAIPLGYLGVDICLDQTEGPLVLEVNGRPGLEIQNVQHRGFNEKLCQTIEAY